ncbi:hypothetical protein [Fulvivirga marina]|nr:hypothetical protein [Fulvivirga marina]
MVQRFTTTRYGNATHPNAVIVTRELIGCGVITVGEGTLVGAGLL